MSAIKVLSFILLICVTLRGTQFVDSKNILVYGVIGSHSIRLSMWPMMEALAEKGHNVTFLSGMVDFEDPNKKSKVFSYTPKKWKENQMWEETNFYDLRKFNQIAQAWLQVREMGLASCEVMYSDPEFVEFVNTSKYDLVIVEMLVNECAYGLAHKWNAKLIIYSSTSVVPHYPDAHGLPDESASISDIIFGYPPGENMSFRERFINVFNPIVFTISREWFYLPKLEEITRKGLGITEKDQLPSFRDIEKNVSLVMLTSHFSLDYPRSLPPYAVPVGGVVVMKEKKPMPKEMETFLDSNKKGFVYISFGSMAEFTHFENKTQIEFINAIYKFPELNFLWKSAHPITVKKLPKNVFVTKWAPQQTVLAHKNIKAFITHGGMGSITEAAHFSVPMICLPVHAEQDTNCRVMSIRDAAIQLEILTLKQSEFEHAISEILNNPKHRAAITRLTRIFKDRQIPPLENAVWWIEYILRHDNTNEFLRPPSINLPWWKKRNVDIWIVSTLILTVVFTSALLILYKLASKLFLMATGFSKSRDYNKIANSNKRQKND